MGGPTDALLAASAFRLTLPPPAIFFAAAVLLPVLPFLTAAALEAAALASWTPTLPKPAPDAPTIFESGGVKSHGVSVISRVAC